MGQQPASSLLQNPVIQKSIRRLKKMGLKVYVQEMDEDSIVMVVDNKSIVETVKRMTDKAITYPKHYVHIDETNNALIIACWRGEEPQWVQKLMSQALLKSR
jgi:hypothetical protein